MYIIYVNNTLPLATDLYMKLHTELGRLWFLLAGLKRFFEIAGASNQWLAGLAFAFPGTMYFFRKKIGLASDAFVKYVVCPKCHALYEFDKCFRNIGTSNVSNKCSFVRFPNHRQQWRRQSCGATLLKEVTLKDGAKKL